jgi:hypothetical protein
VGVTAVEAAAVEATDVKTMVSKEEAAATNSFFVGVGPTVEQCAEIAKELWGIANILHLADIKKSEFLRQQGLLMLAKTASQAALRKRG